jgi:hypothetical protein
VTTRADFTAEEWVPLERAPLVAGMAITLADPGGPIEAFKELSATTKTVLEAAAGCGHGELVEAVAKTLPRRQGSARTRFKSSGRRVRWLASRSSKSYEP